MNASPDKQISKIFLLFTLLFGILVFINPSWIYSRVGWVDTWAYFGHYVDPVGLRNAFPAHPSGDLLPLIWPPALLYLVFKPLIANLIYKWLTFTITSLLFFLLVRHRLGSRTATWGTLFLVLYRYYFIAAGSDYTDGRVILFITTALYLCSVSQMLQSPIRGRIALCLAGFFFCCSFATAILSVILALPLAIFVVGMDFLDSKKVHVDRILFPLLGFVACLSFFALFNFSQSGDFFFFRATTAKVFSFLKLNRGIQEFTFRDLPWLFIPLLCCVGPLLLLLTEKGKEKLSIRSTHSFTFVLWLMNACTLAILAYLQFVKRQESLTQVLYFNQVLPITTFAMSALFLHPVLENLKAPTFKRLTVLFIAINLLFFELSANPTDFSYHGSHVCFYTCLAFALWFFYRRQIESAALSFLLGLFFWNNLGTSKISFIQRDSFLGPYAVSRAQNLESTARWIELVNKIDPMRSRYLWYNRDELFFFQGYAAASHLWQGRVLNEALPELNVPMGEVGIVELKTLFNSGLIIISPSNLELTKAKEALEKHGVTTTCIESISFQVNVDKSIEVSVCNLGASVN